MILVLNAGSSSLKFKLYTRPGFAVAASGMAEQIGEESGVVHVTAANGVEQEERLGLAGHAPALERIFALLKTCGALNGPDDLTGIGHRVVHGGERFHEPVRITSEVIAAIEELIPLSPLHNPANLTGIRGAMDKAPGVPQVAVFDTAFHQSIPDYAYRYALPHRLYEDHAVRRYGFHGTSHHYVSRQAARFLGLAADELNAVSLHLGNGASACAIHQGASVDTSMGLTPLEGLIMGTRCGDLDPAIIFYLARETGMGLDELDSLLNKESGLKGLCGHNDVREILAAAEGGDDHARLAVEMFCYRIKKYIGSYTAVAGPLHCLIFTGGIGEHAALVRARACAGLTHLGIEIEAGKNEAVASGIHDIATPNSPVRVLVVPTDEELEIARHTARLTGERHAGR